MRPSIVHRIGYHAVATHGERWLDMRADRRRTPRRDALELARVRDVPARLRALSGAGADAAAVEAELAKGDGWRAILARRTPERAAVLEAHRSSDVFAAMVANARLVRADPRTLTVTMGAIQRDFGRTLACVVDHLAAARPNMDLASARAAAAALDPATAVLSTRDARHVTHLKHDDAPLLAAVRDLDFVALAARDLAAAAASAVTRCR